MKTTDRVFKSQIIDDGHRYSFSEVDSKNIPNGYGFILLHDKKYLWEGYQVDDKAYGPYITLTDR